MATGNMDALVAEVQKLRAEMENLKLAASQQPQGTQQGDRGQNMEEDDAEGTIEEADEPSWAAILRPTSIEASKPNAQYLCQVLSAPPPLDTLRASEKCMVNYKHVPQTPAPRKNRIDTNLHNPQRKLEHAMNMMVHQLETDDKEALGISAAWVRSAWEDLNQQRRFLLAGKQSFKLDHRANDTRPRLLTKEEEQKIARPRPKPRARPFWGESTSSRSTYAPEQQTHYKPKTPNTPRGKGKGGKDKGL